MLSLQIHSVITAFYWHYVNYNNHSYILALQYYIGIVQIPIIKAFMLSS